MSGKNNRVKLSLSSSPSPPHHQHHHHCHYHYHYHLHHHHLHHHHHHDHHHIVASSIVTFSNCNVNDLLQYLSSPYRSPGGRRGPLEKSYNDNHQLIVAYRMRMFKSNVPAKTGFGHRNLDTTTKVNFSVI